MLAEKIKHALASFAVPASAGGRALDVGCGRQPFRAALEELGYTYTGLDVQQNVEGSVDIIGEIDRPLTAKEAGQFDLILCTEVLEHVADWSAAFANFADLLAPQGRILITCPFFYALHEEPYDFWRPTPYALTFHADRAGLRVLHQEAAGDAWDVLGTLLANMDIQPVATGVVGFVTTKMVRLGRRILFGLLKRRWLQSRFRVKGSIYISNILVLQSNKEALL